MAIRRRACCAPLADEVARELADVPQTAQVQVLGGAKRVVRIEPDPDRLRTSQVSLAELQPALRASQAQLPAGALVDNNKRVELEAKGYVLSANEFRRVIVATRGDRPVYLEDVARVTDGPEPEPAMVVSAAKDRAGFEQAVSIAVAKRPGTNATELAERVLAKVQALKGRLIPASIRVARDPQLRRNRRRRNPTSSSSTC